MGKRVFMNICESCHGYTTDEEMTECPVCGGELAFKPIDVKDKAKYKNLDDMRFDDFASDNEPSFDDPLDDDYTEPKKRNNPSDNNTGYDDNDVDFTPKPRSSSSSRSRSLSSSESFTANSNCRWTVRHKRFTNSPKSNVTLTFRSAEVQISIMARATMTAHPFGTE